MNITALVLLAAAVLVVTALFLKSKNGPDDSSTIGDGEFFMSTESQSQERAGRVLPLEGSQDASHLVRVPVPPSQPDLDEDRDNLPDEKSDWVVTIDFEPPATMNRAQILEEFSSDWHNANGNPQLLGFSPEDGRWTYVRAGGVPDTYTRLCIGWSLCDPLCLDEGPVSMAQLEDHLESLDNPTTVFGNPRIQPSCSVRDAHRRSVHLHQLISECDRDALIAVVAPEGSSFEGRDIWDTMLSLGLKWGNMDLFNLDNPSAELGGDYLFSVWTSTPPGHFFPEEIAAGRVRTADLIFGFSVPRSPDPLAVHDAMVNAARYAQSRLGGTLLGANNQPFNQEASRAEAQRVVERLASEGMLPGTSLVLSLF